MALKEFVLSKIVKRVLADPVYKNFYCFKIVRTDGDCFLSPVMDHENHMIYHKGLVMELGNRRIRSFELIASALSEDEATDAMYLEQSFINEQLRD